jgi:hypothetical protein
MGAFFFARLFNQGILCPCLFVAAVFRHCCNACLELGFAAARASPCIDSFNPFELA